MRKLLLIPAVLALVLVAAPAALAQADRDCADFATQAEAQAYFDSRGGSAANNVDRLDSDSDGVPCEELPPGDASGGSEERLPFTGPTPSTLPLGSVLLAVGALLLWVVRYRPRHARS